jgi:hypothetical protein
MASLRNAFCLNTAELCQAHQILCVEPSFTWMINDMGYLKEACRAAFEGSLTAPSSSQQQVSETLGLSVEDEIRCPKSGYSIDMIPIRFFVCA